MCRLFGFRAAAPATVEQALLTERNSLRAQSREHADGWGVVSWHSADSHSAAHGLQPAYADPDFDRVCRQLRSRTLLAHVRRASIGPVERCNAHPFVEGRWAFAHNGTVESYEERRPHLEGLIDPDLRARIRGATDSERCFYAVLTELRRLGDGATPTPLRVATALARTMVKVAALTDPGSPRPSSLNFMITDGEMLVATRRCRTLHLAELDEDVTGPDRVLIASETVQVAGWQELPEDGVVAIDAELRVQRWTLTDLTG